MGTKVQEAGECDTGNGRLWPPISLPLPPPPTYLLIKPCIIECQIIVGKDKCQSCEGLKKVMGTHWLIFKLRGLAF